MPYVVVPVIGQKSHHIKSVRIIDSQQVRLTVHATDHRAQLEEGDDQLPVALTGLTEHPTLADAVLAARKLLGDASEPAVDRSQHVGFT
jgi:hypothetical protein